jgi:hypothetical protein
MIAKDIEEIAWACVDVTEANYWGLKNVKTEAVVRGRARVGKGAAVKNANNELEKWRQEEDKLRCNIMMEGLNHGYMPSQYGVQNQGIVGAESMQGADMAGSRVLEMKMDNGVRWP